MRVTAVITTHRRPHQLAHALASVLCQTLPVDEVIVVEDGADRETVAVVRDAAARARPMRVRHIRVPPASRTPAASRNLGACLATSEFVAFLDDDDTWLPEKNAQQAAALEHADLVCGNARCSDGAIYFRDSTSRVIGSSELRDHNPVITSTAVVSRSRLLACGGFSESPFLVACEDFDMWLRMHDAGGELRMIDAEMAIYSVSGDDRLSVQPRRSRAGLVVVGARDVARHPAWMSVWRAFGRALVGPITSSSLVSALRRLPSGVARLRGP